MSVLIEIMDVPDSCDVCEFVKELDFGPIGTSQRCGFPGIGMCVDGYIAVRHEACPLIEVVRTGEGLYETYTPPSKEVAEHVTEVFRKSTERMEAEE